MNFEGAKENIQPLAAGRNVERLEVALNAESHPECQQLLLEQRKQFEREIAAYVGDDPLDLWFEYVLWVEQSYPKSGKESALDELLKKCLSTFEKDLRYGQDQRLVRLFIKYIDTKKNPHVYYTKLYNAGVGTMVADLYIAWAHYYDILDNFEQAQQVYQKGLDARATPIDQLKQAHERFQFSVSQRVLRKDAYRQEFLTSMEERRSAFTSLRSLKSSKVGSIRTGSAVRSSVPGQVRQNQENRSSVANVPIQVYEGHSSTDVRSQPPLSTSVVQDIQNGMLENNVEPGPWSKATSRRSVYSGKHDQNSTLRLAILEDTDVEQPPIIFGPLPKDTGENAIKLPARFAQKNQPQTPFIVPLFVEESKPANVISNYDFIAIHPNTKDCICMDQVRAYKRYKKANISNALTQRLDKIFLNNSIRSPPTFAKKNLLQTDFETERPDISTIPESDNYAFNLSALYPDDSKEELSFEELMREKRKNAIGGDEAMDETVCIKGRQSFGMNYARKSRNDEGRKSIVPVSNDRKSTCIRKSTFNVASPIEEANSDMEIDDYNAMEAGKSGRNDMNMGSSVKHQENATSSVPVEKTEMKKIQSTAPRLQWSVLNDEEPKEASPVQQTEVKKAPPTTPRVQWSILDDSVPKKPSPVQLTELEKNSTTPRVQWSLLNDAESKIASPVEQTEVKKTQWSIFNDNESKTTSPIISSENAINEGDQKNNENSPLCSGWSVFTDDESNLVTPHTKNVCSSADVDKAKTVFAVPQSRPLSEPSAEKRTLETGSNGSNGGGDGPQLKKTFLDRSPYPIGPHTGAIKKIRTSSIAENAFPINQSAASSRGRIPSTNDENTFKLPEPIDQVRTMSHENTELDFSLCTAKFNHNLGDQMISTPVTSRQRESRTDPSNAQETIQPPQPLKLSTIMETTEGSAHTASTKSSIQFSSPEDDDPSKRSNVMNRTKFVSAGSGSDSDLSSNNCCKSDGECNEKSIVNAEKQLTSPVKQHLVENSLPTIQFSVFLDDKNATEKVLEFSPNVDTKEVTTPAQPSSSKHYPFPIFEDTQVTAADEKPAKQPTPKIRESLLNFFTTSPEPRSKCARTPISSQPHTTQPSEHLIGNTQPSEPERHSSQSSKHFPQEPPKTPLLGSSLSEPSFQFALPLEPSAKSLMPLEPPLQASLPLEPSYQSLLSAEPSVKMSLLLESTSDPQLQTSLPEPSAEILEVCKPPPNELQSNSRFELSSICIKEEPHSFSSFGATECGAKSFIIPQIAGVQSLAPTESQNVAQNVDPAKTAMLQPISTEARVSISLTEAEMEEHLRRKMERQHLGTQSDATFVNKSHDSNEDESSEEEVIEVADDTLTDAANCDQSIYFKHNSIYAEPSWREDIAENVIVEEDNSYEHEFVNLEESRITIENKLAVGDVDPFDEVLKTALLQELGFIHYFEAEESTCQLVKKVSQVSVKGTINFKETHFDVLSCIGHGAFGRVYSVKLATSGQLYAVKKEVPANVWECYILTEVRKRISNEKLLPGLMTIEYAVIGNNASLLFSKYSPHGTLLDVCNRVFTSMRHNVEESIVFILAIQMLDIIDHLHAAGILHLDLKPDNFLVMKPLSTTNYREIFIQLIDFGNAVDLRQFPREQKFNAALETKNFVCIEMAEKRSWIFQPDLYCLAGTIHSVLFGCYMEVYKKGLNYEIRKSIPRYYKRSVWEVFFKKLINIRNHSQPDLQEIKESFYCAIDEDKKLNQKIVEFNKFIVG